MSTIPVDLAVRRAARVQEAVTVRGWSVATAVALADELGVSVRTIRRTWAAIQRWTRASLDPSDVEAMRLRQVVRLEHNIAAAAAAGQYGAAFKGEQVYGQLTGTIAPQKAGGTVGVALPVFLNYPHLATMSAAELEESVARLSATVEVLVNEGEAEG